MLITIELGTIVG